MTNQEDAPKSQPLWQRAKILIAEYGPAALVIYWLIFAVVFLLAAAGLKRGFGDVLGGYDWGSLGIWGGAYAVAKVLQIPRLALTAAITPKLAHRFGWVRKGSGSGSESESGSGSEP